MIRVVLPHHLRTLARVEGEVALEIGGAPGSGATNPYGGDGAGRQARVGGAGTVTLGAVLDALEAAHPVLRGTIRDRRTGRRRPLVRLYACGQDLSDSAPDTPLPAAVASGAEPLRVVGAMAGG